MTVALRSRSTLAAMLASLTMWVAGRAQVVASTAGESESDGPKITGFAPLDYFQNQCARCHGDYGAAYGDKFAKNITYEQLQKFVRDMAEGPAQAPLNDPDLALETDFHRALRDKQPFAVAVAWKDGVLSGEALPGSKLRLEHDGKSVEVVLDGPAWQVSLPAATAWETVVLHVENDGKKAAIPLGKRAF